MENSIKMVKGPITIKELLVIAEGSFGDLVKAVVDIEKEIMAVGGELHADEEQFLLEKGSVQENLWGINLYPGNKGASFLEFDSMINLRPRQGNRTRSVDNAVVRKKIKEVVKKLVKR